MPRFASTRALSGDTRALVRELWFVPCFFLLAVLCAWAALSDGAPLPELGGAVAGFALMTRFAMRLARRRELPVRAGVAGGVVLLAGIVAAAVGILPAPGRQLLVGVVEPLFLSLPLLVGIAWVRRDPGVDDDWA
jgi:hydrogenase/urease accessory protein HupE